MAKSAQTRASGTRGKKPTAKGPPKNFVISWREEEHGPVLGYAIVERVAYFPTTVQGHPDRGPQRNASDPAFAELFESGIYKKVILPAVALPNGSVSDPGFQVDVRSMSG